MGVPFGTSKLLRNSSYTPTVTLANFSAQPRTAEVLLADSSSGTPKVTSIAQMSVPAYSTKTMRLTGATGIGVQNSITVKSDGQPGDVQVHLFAGEIGTERRVEMLAKDAKDDHNGGNHPWSIANGDESTLLLHNPTATQQVFQVQISAGPSQWSELFTLVPSETKSLSIGDVIQKRTRDHVGQMLPKSVTTGEVLWFTSFGASGLGRLLVSNQSSAMTRNFSCTQYTAMCGASFSPNSYLTTEIDTDASYNTVSPVACIEYSPSSCSQNPTVSAYLSFITSWSGTYASLNSVNYSYPTALGLHSTGIGGFNINGVVTSGSCQAQVFGGGTITPHCPTGVTISSFDPESLSPLFPDTRTGVGGLAEMLVSGPNSSYDGSNIYESVTVSSNSCSTYFNLPASFNQSNSPFVVGVSANRTDGSTASAKPNVFYDHHEASFASSILPAGASCSITLQQQYSCNGTNLGEVFQITYNFQAGTYNGAAVTNVTVVKQ